MTDKHAAIASIGDNLPPNDAEILKETLAAKHERILAGAQRLVEAADRLPEIVEDEKTAGRLADYIKQVSGSRKNLEAERVNEKEPYLTLGRVVDGFFKSATDALDTAKTKASRKLDAWVQAKAAAERQRRAEEAIALQRQAEEEAAAAKMLEDARMVPQAEKMIEQAAITEKVALHIAQSVNDRPASLAKTRGETGATGSLRTRWVGEIVSASDLDLNLLRPFLNHEGLQKALNLFVAAGNRELRGAKIYEKSEVVVR